MLKKFFLVCVGIIAALAVAEILMWIVFFSISYLEQYFNRRQLIKYSEQNVVLCIGESTTAKQYPVQLRRILNKKHKNGFAIIDCGIPGTFLSTISDAVDQDIKLYKPDIAVCMMGINDTNNITDDGNFYIENIVNNVKIYKLYKWLSKNYKINLRDRQFSDNRVIRKYIETSPMAGYAVKLFYKGERDRANQIFQTILKEDPDNEMAYYYLVLNAFFDDRKKGVEMSKKALERNFMFRRVDYYTWIIEYYDDTDKNISKYYAETASADKKLVAGPDFYVLVKNIIGPSKRKGIMDKIAKNYSEDVLCGMIALEEMKRKNYNKADKYFEAAKNIRLKYQDEEYIGKYRGIIKKLTDNNIKVICMQYPVRSIEPLKNILKNEKYYDRLIFVSNEDNFKNMLKIKKYNNIFQDQFAGDFGHCTDFGNKIIAENIADVLEKIVKKSDGL